MTSNITSRRALLRAATTVTAYAAGAAIVGTGIAVASEVQAETVDRSEWDRAYARYQTVLADYNKGSDDPGEENRLGEIEVEAWTALLMLPAPDGEAAIFKMDYLFDGRVTGFCDSWSMAIVNVLKADMRRLLARRA